MEINSKQCIIVKLEKYERLDIFQEQHMCLDNQLVTEVKLLLTPILFREYIILENVMAMMPKLGELIPKLIKTGELPNSLELILNIIEVWKQQSKIDSIFA